MFGGGRSHTSRRYGDNALIDGARCRPTDASSPPVVRAVVTVVVSRGRGGGGSRRGGRGPVLFLDAARAAAPLCPVSNPLSRSFPLFNSTFYQIYFKTRKNKRRRPMERLLRYRSRFHRHLSSQHINIKHLLVNINKDVN